MTGRGRPRTVNHYQVEALLRGGASVDEVAADCFTHRTTVLRIKRDAEAAGRLALTPKLTVEKVRDLYVVQLLPQSKVAEALDVGSATLTRWLTDVAPHLRVERLAVNEARGGKITGRPPGKKA